jgi:hypothetical protein
MKKKKRNTRFKTHDLKDVIKDLRATPKGELAWQSALKERREAWVQHWLKVQQHRLRLRKRLLRRWKGTALEVKTFCQMGDQREPWIFRYVTFPIPRINTTTGTASVRTNRFSATFSTL